MALRPSSTLVILCLRCMGWSCQLKDHGLPVFGKSIWVRHHHSIESGFPLETSVPSNLQTMLLYLYLLKHLKFLYFFESWEHKTARYARYHHGILREIRTHCRKEKTEIRKDFSQHREPCRATLTADTIAPSTYPKRQPKDALDDYDFMLKSQTHLTAQNYALSTPLNGKK